MSAVAWASHGEEWADDDKVAFNGNAREIHVLSHVTDLDIRADLYSAWVRWHEREENERYYLAMRFTGLDPIPGGSTGDTYFLINNWKLVYDPRKVAITGILYSDDYATPYYFLDGEPVYPATVSALGIRSNVTLDYNQLAIAVAQQFAEPEMTTAGIASAIGTVDVDSAEIADEVAGRFTFGDDGRVAADIDGSKSMKQLKQHVSAAIPTPPAPSTMWNSAPKWLKKPAKIKDHSDAIRTIGNKLDGLYQSLQLMQANQPVTPQAFDASGIEREIQNVQSAISAIEIPDGAEGIESIRALVEPLEGQLDAIQSEVLGVRENVREIEFPETDISSLATREEMSALRSLVAKLSNYDDSDIRQILEAAITTTESLSDDIEVVSQKTDLVLDNQLRLL